MKLNLLPQTVRTGGKSKGAWFLAALMAAFGIAAAVMMSIKADGTLKDSSDALQAAQPQAQKAYDTSVEADTIINSTQDVNVIKNTGLANAMIDHNAVYPAMYEELFRFNPPIFRLTSISATPIDGTTASITMTGTITTYQQYADLMLALMRNKKVISVSRSGFNYDDLQVPPLVPTDQQGRPRKPGEAPIPDDPLLRLTYFESQPQQTGFSGAGNFGSGQPNEREAMPGESLITVQMVALYALQTPNPLGTLSSEGAGTATVAAPAAGGSTTPAGVPGVPGAPAGGPGSPMAPASIPNAPPTAGGGRGGPGKRGQGGAD